MFVTSQYVKGIGPIIRSNADLFILQPMYDVTSRQTVWELCGSFIPEKKKFYAIMDEYCRNVQLDGHTARNPKLEVHVMVVKHFNQVPIVQERFFAWIPKHTDELEPYRLCAKEYWQDRHMLTGAFQSDSTQDKERPNIHDVYDEFDALATLN